MKNVMIVSLIALSSMMVNAISINLSFAEYSINLIEDADNSQRLTGATECGNLVVVANVVTQNENSVVVTVSAYATDEDNNAIDLGLSEENYEFVFGEAKTVTVLEQEVTVIATR